MAVQMPTTYPAQPSTSSNLTFVANLPSRETVSTSKTFKAATIHYSSKGRMVKVKLPPSSGQESSDRDGGKFDDEIPEKEVAFLLLEAKELPVPISIPQIAAAALPGTIAAERDDKGDKEIAQANVTEERETAGRRNDSPATSAPTANRKSSPFAFGNALSIPTTSFCLTPSRGSILNFTAAWNNNLELTLPESLSMSLPNNLLFIEVFKIQEIDRKSHACQGLDATGAQCKTSVPRCHSLSIKFVENSLSITDGIKDKEIQSLAMYSMCDVHTKQSAQLAKKWIRLAKLTEAARKYWLNQQSSLSVESKAPWNIYAEFAAAEVRRILAQDEITVRAEKEKTELYNESQKTITWLQAKIGDIESGIFPAEELNKPSKKGLTEHINRISALEKQINNLTTENSSLREARNSTEDVLAKERKRNQLDLLHANYLYKESQKTVEALHKEVSALTSKVAVLTTENSPLKDSQALLKEKECSQQDLQDAKSLNEGSQRTFEALRKEVDALKSSIGELTTKESSLEKSLELTQGALTKEKVRSRELEIRLEERVALGIKTQDSPEMKLEKYLRDELDKSQRHILQRQKDFEKLHNDHVRLQITNATLESQVKHIEADKEELSRTSKEGFQELAERNSDLSSQLRHTRARLEQLKAGLAAIEKEKEAEISKSKFSLRDIYRRPKNESSTLLTPPTDE